MDREGEVVSIYVKKHLISFFITIGTVVIVSLYFIFLFTAVELNFPVDKVVHFHRLYIVPSLLFSFFHCHGHHIFIIVIINIIIRMPVVTVTVCATVFLSL